MDLIYARFNGNVIEDVDVLQDYTFDEVYGIGDNCNDFECKVQKYNNKCKEDDLLYVEFTEYGGIIDTVGNDSKSGVVAYKGRTWHGILNSHVIEPLRGVYARYYNGEVNEILGQMIIDLDLSEIFVVDVVPNEDRDIEINSFEVRYEKGYDAIVKLLKAVNGKLICYFYNGKVHLGIVRCVDYSHDEEFDTGQTPYKVSSTVNNVNHLICMGKGDGENRAVIHLYTDGGASEGSIQPYKLIPNPKEDSEYILDNRNQILTGREEITDIFDCPSAEIITNYKLWHNKPTDWATNYTNYFEDGEIDESTGQYKKEKIKKQERDEFRLLPTQPADWETQYTDYYYWDADKDGAYYKTKSTSRWGSQIVGDVIVKSREGDYGAKLGNGSANGKGAFTTVKALAESESRIEYQDVTNSWGGSPPPDWATKYGEYYTDRGASEKEAVAARTYDRYGTGDTYDGLTFLEHTGAPLATQPPDWTWNFANYCTYTLNAANKKVFVGVEGVHHYRADKVTKATKNPPSDWSNTWGNYYINVEKKKLKKGSKIEKIEGKYITARDGLAQGFLTKISNDKPYPKYQKGKYYILTQIEDTAPTFGSYYKHQYHGIFEKFSFSVAPVWDIANKHYYKKIVHDAPSFSAKPYYKLYEDIEQIPDFKAKPYYYAVEDRMRKLVESGIEKLLQLADNSSLDISLDLDSNYDVLDILGVSDEVTQQTVVKPILRKIIKIKKDILTIDYEVE